MMRKITLALNLIVFVFFVCFLAYTFIARQHLSQLARTFVTQKTLHYSEPIVVLTEEAMKSPLTKKLLTDEQISAIQNELANYHKDASGYISDLTGPRVRKLPLKKANPLHEKIGSIKEKIRTYYTDTLAVLIRDLRIFSISNLVAASIAFWLAYRSTEQIQKSILWFSFLMFAAVLYSSYMYIDDLTFFRILFRSHLGWAYPVLLCIVILSFYLEYGKRSNAKRAGGTVKI